MKKVLAITALVGVASPATSAQAAPVAATLLEVRSYSNGGYSVFNLSASTATWTFDVATGTAAITSGTYYGEVISPNVFGHTMAGVSLGNFVPSLGTWSCQEGTFGSAVGASLCGNYNFGSNKKNQSTYTPTAQSGTVVTGGDDRVIGAPQSLQTSYSNMTSTSIGSGRYILSNAPFPGGGSSKSGYDFLFAVGLPLATDDSFSAFKNTPTTMAILANDVGWTDPVSVALFNLPAHGTAVVTGSPGAQSGIRIDYTPAPGFTGTDTFQYVVDNGTEADIANVTVTVNPTFAVSDSAGTVAPSPVVIDVLGNDVGFVDPVTVGIVNDPSHGSVVIDGSPGNMAGITVTYTPAIGFTGTDTFDYSVDDGVNADSGTVTVVVVQDTDGDGVYDHQDNCRTTANPNQRDTNSDGYGNLCDADLDNNGFVNFTDLSLFKQKFTTADPDANLDGIGIVNFSDLAIFKSLFGKPPGPSGTTP